MIQYWGDRSKRIRSRRMVMRFEASPRSMRPCVRKEVREDHEFKASLGYRVKLTQG